VTIGSSVAHVGDWAFAWNNGLTSATIPFGDLPEADRLWGGTLWRSGLPNNVSWIFYP